MLRLRQEDANLQAALTWAFEAGDGADLERGLHLVGTLTRYWLRCGRLSEARSWLTRASNASANREPSLGQARVLEGMLLIEQVQAAVEPATSSDEHT